MKRESIDAAGLAQFDRRVRLLRDVVRSGGTDNWSHLFSHGHHHTTIASAVHAGYLRRTGTYSYEITEAGNRCLDDIDAHQLRSQA